MKKEIELLNDLENLLIEMRNLYKIQMQREIPDKILKELSIGRNELYQATETFKKYNNLIISFEKKWTSNESNIQGVVNDPENRTKSVQEQTGSESIHQ